MKSAPSATVPDKYSVIKAESEEVGFSMPSDLLIGSLLKTLTVSKPNSNILELGTGAGLSASWILSGMDNISQLTTIDNNPELAKIAQKHLGGDERISILCKMPPWDWKIILALLLISSLQMHGQVNIAKLISP